MSVINANENHQYMIMKEMLRNAWCQTLTAYLLTALREDLGSRDCVTLDGYARMKACGVKAVVL